MSAGKAFLLAMIVVGAVLAIGGYEPATRHSSPLHADAGASGR